MAGARWQESWMASRDRSRGDSPGAPAAADDERIKQLERLQELKRSGVLDEEELAAEKKRILSG